MMRTSVGGERRALGEPEKTPERVDRDGSAVQVHGSRSPRGVCRSPAGVPPCRQPGGSRREGERRVSPPQR
ncbi:hypothetical protein [Methanoculleus chikugoensis]|uniref:hypothetical protein n=1 Tax=Methanoculleus chikugoensis TaxID=118126 RepID=UPI001FB264A7|nr:hypothetical protein [Methanoculleus chikugoensis]